MSEWSQTTVGAGVFVTWMRELEVAEVLKEDRPFRPSIAGVAGGQECPPSLSIGVFNPLEGRSRELRGSVLSGFPITSPPFTSPHLPTMQEEVFPVLALLIAGFRQTRFEFTKIAIP